MTAISHCFDITACATEINWSRTNGWSSEQDVFARARQLDVNIGISIYWSAMKKVGIVWNISTVSENITTYFLANKFTIYTSVKNERFKFNKKLDKLIMESVKAIKKSHPNSRRYFDWLKPQSFDGPSENTVRSNRFQHPPMLSTTLISK